jgi:MSHA biogenesis protein MshJ
MKLLGHINRFLVWYDRLSLRERVLVMAAALAILVGAFNMFFMRSLEARRKELALELSTVQAEMDTAAKAALAATAADPIAAQTQRVAALRARLAATDAQLASQAAGMIPPKRMMQVLHDVLSRQRGLTLVSLRYLGATALPDATASASGRIPRPYLHTVEIIVQGSYLDVLAYLRALEALPWRFYWRRLELTTTHYPTNEVRLELGTVSMDSDWIGL